MKNIISLFMILSFLSASLHAQDKTVEILNGNFESKRRTQRFDPFLLAKGDVLKVDVKCNHRRRAIDLVIKQHPGKMIVFDYEELSEGTFEFVAPADGIYVAYYGGKRLDFDISLSKQTEKPDGPGRELVYVSMPDTVHTSGNVRQELGENYTLTPVKEKVVLGTQIVSETIANYDFMTGVDKVRLSIPGNHTVPYRDKQLLSWSLSLTCGSSGVYDAMMGVVDEGIDSFVKLPEFGSKKNSKIEKGKPQNNYEFTDDLKKKKKDNRERNAELISLSADAAEIMAPGSKGAEAAQTVAYVMDGGEIKDIAIEKSLEAMGASDEVYSIMGKVQSIPSVNDLLKDGAEKIIPKIDGKVNLSVVENKEKVILKTKEEIDSIKSLKRISGEPLYFSDMIASRKWEVSDRFNDSGGFITHTFDVQGEDVEFDPYFDYLACDISIKKANFESQSKLMVDATYKVTEYTDMVTYKRETKPVYFEEFETAYKIYYTYDIIFKDQMKDYYVEVPENIFFQFQDSRVAEKRRVGEFERLNKFELLSEK